MLKPWQWRVILDRRSMMMTRPSDLTMTFEDFCREYLGVKLADWQIEEARDRLRQRGKGSLPEILEEIMAEGTPMSETKNTEKSGGTRFSEGKPGGWWYAPLYGLRLVAEVWQAGAAKYAPMDWRNGQSFSTLIDCAMRHSLAVVQFGPWARDEDYYVDSPTPGADRVLVKGTGAYHAACAAWNWLALLTFMALGRRDLDDVTGWQNVTTAVKNEKGFSFENPPPSSAIPEVADADTPDPRTARSVASGPGGCGDPSCRVCYPLSARNFFERGRREL